LSESPAALPNSFVIRHAQPGNEGMGEDKFPIGEKLAAEQIETKSAKPKHTSTGAIEVICPYQQKRVRQWVAF
jgi:hypothetical protein